MFGSLHGCHGVSLLLQTTTEESGAKPGAWPPPHHRFVVGGGDNGPPAAATTAMRGLDARPRPQTKIERDRRETRGSSMRAPREDSRRRPAPAAGAGLRPRGLDDTYMTRPGKAPRGARQAAMRARASRAARAHTRAPPRRARASRPLSARSCGPGPRRGLSWPWAWRPPPPSAAASGLLGTGACPRASRPRASDRSRRAAEVEEVWRSRVPGVGRAWARRRRGRENCIRGSQRRPTETTQTLCWSQSQETGGVTRLPTMYCRTFAA